MGFFDKLKAVFSGNGNPSASEEKLVKVFSYNPFFGDSSSEEEANAIYQSCIDQYSTTISKIKPIITKKGMKADDMPNLDFLLRYKPNKLQTANDFYSQLADDYFHRTCSVIWIDRDYMKIKTDEQVKNLWIIDPVIDNFKISAVEDNDNFEKKLKFTFNLNGTTRSCFDEDIIILPWHPTHENPYLRSNKALKNILRISNRNFKGLEETLNNANTIRFIATAPRVMPEQDLKVRQEWINKMISSVTANGALYLDSTQDVKQLASSPGWNHSSEVKAFENEILMYFELCEDIINNKCSDDVYNQWIEGPVSSFLDKLETALTLKLLPYSDIRRGRKIEVSSAPLYRRSRLHQIQLANTIISSGVYYPNEIRTIVGVPLLDDIEDVKVSRIDRVDASAMEEEADEEKGGNENESTGNEEKGK